MSDQFAFTDLIEEMEAVEHARVDAHRTKVQAWFDALMPKQQNDLASLFASSEWLTCQALSAAAGDHHRSQSKQHPVNANVNGAKVAVCAG